MAKLEIDLNNKASCETAMQILMALGNETFTSSRPAPAQTADAAPLAPTTPETVNTLTPVTDMGAPVIDADGMPFDPTIHALNAENLPSITAKGLFKSKKGQADAAKNARASFKAGGAGVVPPTQVADTTPVAPVVPPAPATTAAPLAAPVMPPAPVAPPAPAAPVTATYEQFVVKSTAMSQGGSITPEQLGQIYMTAGVTDFATVGPAMDPAIVSNIYAQLCAIQPDA